MEYNKAANTCPEPAGILLAIGGKEDKGDEVKKIQEKQKDAQKEEDAKETGRSEILKAFIHLTGKENPAIEIITTASSEGDEMFKTYKEVFAELKITNIGHIHHATREEVTADKSLPGKVNKADAFFF